MEGIFYDPSHPAAFGGIDRLARASNKPKAVVKKYLNTQKSYRKYRVPIRKQKRARIVVSSYGVQYMTDLFDLSKFSKFNSNYKWICLVVDSFSRFVKCEPLKRKTGEETARGLDKIFSELKNENKMGVHAQIFSDLGQEFFNSKCDEIYSKYNITHLPLRAPIKAGLAEISGRYILEKLYKIMDHTNSKRWIDVLPTVVAAKNKRKNRKTANLAPADINADNQKSVYESLFPQGVKTGKYTLNVGDRVQVLAEKMPFRKSFAGYYAEKTFRIKTRHSHTVPRYTIVDEDDNEEISGTFYGFELYKL